MLRCAACCRWPLFRAASVALAQQPPTVRIRGTIEAVDGPTLTIKSREGTDMKVHVTDNVAVFGVAKTDLSEIKAGLLYRRHRDAGTRRHPEGARGSYLPGEPARRGRRFSALGSACQCTMTNATVAETVKGTDGQNILVKYKDGEKKVVVPPGTPIVTFVAGDKSELKPGAKIIIFGATKKDDGTLEANRVNVGRDGIMPPM